VERQLEESELGQKRRLEDRNDVSERKDLEPKPLEPNEPKRFELKPLELKSLDLAPRKTVEFEQGEEPEGELEKESKQRAAPELEEKRIRKKQGEVEHLFLEEYSPESKRRHSWSPEDDKQRCQRIQISSDKASFTVEDAEEPGSRGTGSGVFFASEDLRRILNKKSRRSTPSRSFAGSPRRLSAPTCC